ncbi:hypothetical protein D3C78_894570 [compost metagenome]
MAAGRRLQVEVEVFHHARRVGHLGLGRRLEAPGRADIAVQIVGERIEHAQRRHVLLETSGAAGIAVDQEVVVHLHLHVAVPEARQQSPVAERPVGLHVRIEARCGIQLVAAQFAFYAQLVAAEVLETTAIIPAPVVIDAERQAQLSRNARHGLQPAQGAAMEVAVEIHHAAATLAVGDRRTRDGEKLQHAALTGVSVDLQGGVTEPALVVQAGLLVVDALAGVEQHRVGRHRTRVVVEAFPGLAQRVFRVVLFQAAEDQRQAAVVVGFQVEFGEGLIATGGAVVAIAVGIHARSVEQEAGGAGLVAALGIDMVPAQVVAAEDSLRPDPWRPFSVAGEHLDHPAAVAAVERCGRPAQYLETLGHVEVEGRRLPLAVRCARRNAIHQQLDATHTECRPRAEAARGNLQVLGVVLAVLHHQAGHPRQRFGGVDAQLPLGDLPAVDAIHRGGLVEAAAQAVAAGDHHRVQILPLVGRHGSRHAAQQQTAGKTR